MQMHQLASLTQMSGKGHMRSTNEIKPKWQNCVHHYFFNFSNFNSKYKVNTNFDISISIQFNFKVKISKKETC